MPQPRKDAVHKYFIYVKDTNTSVCQLCEKKLKGKHTSNLKSHLAVKHIIEFKSVSDINQGNYTNKKNIKENNIVTNNIKDICIKLITVHGRPLAMLNDDAFQRLMSLAVQPHPDVKLHINEKSIKHAITEQAYIVKNKISDEIKNKMVCIKIDSASCAERKFIGINLQYIKDAMMVVRNIAVVEACTPLTATFFKETLEGFLAEFNIGNNQIYCVCIDDGANMNKIKLIGGKYYIEENGDDRSEAHEDDRQEKEGQSAPYLADGNTDENVFYTEQFVKDCLPTLLSSTNNFNIRGMLCAAYTLQLTIKDALNDDINAKATIVLARRVVTILRKPNNANILNEAGLKKPIHDCTSRWTSTFDLLERLLTYQDISDTIPELSSLLSSKFWKDIIALVESMKPVHRATLELQRDNLTIGDFYISWLNCKNFLKGLVHFEFAKNLVNAMEVREVKLLKCDIVLECLYLDRRLNLMLSNEDCEKAKKLIKETYNHLKTLRNDQSSSNLNVYEEKPPIPSTSTNSTILGLEEMLAKAERDRGCSRQMHSFDAALDDLICCPRLPLNENIIKAWNTSVTSSELAMVAKTVLAVPSTQVSVVRLFTSLKFMLNPLRSNLNPYFLNDLMLVRENTDLLD